MIGKNTIIFFLIGVIIIMGGILVFSNTQNNSSNTTQNNSGLQPRILVSEEEWDFGKVIQGEKPTHIFIVKNEGEGDLIIEPTHIFIVKNEGEGDLIIDSLKESCACIEVSISATRIQPGGSAELKVTYDTTDYVGEDEKHIHIYSNDPLVPDKRINLYVETEKPKIPYLND
jgi:hypothetical protein